MKYWIVDYNTLKKNGGLLLGEFIPKSKLKLIRFQMINNINNMPFPLNCLFIHDKVIILPREHYNNEYELTTDLNSRAVGVFPMAVEFNPIDKGFKITNAFPIDVTIRENTGVSKALGLKKGDVIKKGVSYSLYPFGITQNPILFKSKDLAFQAYRDNIMQEINTFSGETLKDYPDVIFSIYPKQANEIIDMEINDIEWVLDHYFSNTILDFRLTYITGEDLPPNTDIILWFQII